MQQYWPGPEGPSRSKMPGGPHAAEAATSELSLGNLNALANDPLTGLLGNRIDPLTGLLGNRPTQLQNLSKTAEAPAMKGCPGRTRLVTSF